MKKIRIFLIIMLAMTISVLLTSCWNYREIDKLAIVTGVAVDKDTNGQYILTAEIAKVSGGRETKTISEVVTMKGRTMFDAVRNGISITGKRLYWSHSKALILSKEVASEGMIKVIDWYIRDAEPREDVNVLISEGASAKEIFEGQGTTEDIRSFTLNEVEKNQEKLSNAPTTDILKYGIESQTKGISTLIPTIVLKKTDNKLAPQVIGTAIIKNDKLAGFLNGEETKDLLFIRNEVKGGVLVGGTQENAAATYISLEILKNETKVTPIIDGINIKINLDIDTTVAINEIDSRENVIDEDGRTKLEQSIERKLKEQVESLIKKIQSEYDADIFKFGTKMREDKSKIWDRVKNNWEEIFKDLPVNVKTKVHIKNSAVLSKPVEEGEY